VESGAWVIVRRHVGQCRVDALPCPLSRRFLAHAAKKPVGIFGTVRIWKVKREADCRVCINYDAPGNVSGVWADEVFK